ncbi:hypothetical protein, partial [Plasmodium yoelii yoelii]
MYYNSFLYTYDR